MGRLKVTHGSLPAVEELQYERIKRVLALSNGLLAQIFSQKALALRLQEELVSENLVEKIASWRKPLHAILALYVT
jgi:hypothetical protein